MNISVIIAKALGVILLLVWLVFLPAGRICLRQMIDLLFWEPRDNLHEKFEMWLEQAGSFQKITVSIIYKVIIKTFCSISAGSDRADYFKNRIIYSMYMTILRWYILPFIVGIGLILSGSLWMILVLPVAWILSTVPFFPFFIVTGLIVIIGWIYGGLIFSYFSSTSKFWHYISCAMGVVFLVISCIIIEVILGIRKLGGIMNRLNDSGWNRNK
jgi:hypothetical protein